MKTSGKYLKIASALIAIFIAVSSTEDALQKLNISLDQAQNYVSQTVQYGQLSYPMSANKIAPAMRLQVLKDMTTFAKSFCQSSVFKSQYTDWWQNQRPEKPASIEDRKKEIADKKAADKQSANEGTENLKKQIKDAPDAATKKTMEDALKQYEEMQKQMEAQMKTPEMVAMMAQMDSMQQQQIIDDFKNETERYNTDSIAWMQKKNPDAAIKILLNKYLTLVNTVDFKATTTKNNYGKLIFDNADYEQKPSDWKQCYRAGKELNDFAKTFAQQWLSELK